MVLNNNFVGGCGTCDERETRCNELSETGVSAGILMPTLLGDLWHTRHGDCARGPSCLRPKRSPLIITQTNETNAKSYPRRGTNNEKSTDVKPRICRGTAVAHLCSGGTAARVPWPRWRRCARTGCSAVPGEGATSAQTLRTSHRTGKGGPAERRPRQHSRCSRSCRVNNKQVPQ